MQASTQDSVLIEQVVYLASKARVATGQKPIYDIPKGLSSRQSCPIAKALNLSCCVSSTGAIFTTPKDARAVGEALGLIVFGHEVRFPIDHPFKRFVTRFDRQESKVLRELRG